MDDLKVKTAVENIATASNRLAFMDIPSNADGEKIRVIMIIAKK